MAAKQHGVVSRRQLLELGLSRRAIEHRLARGRLHLVRRGVYAVGRREISRHGGWMAAILAVGPQAVLSHRSAGALLGICSEGRHVEVSASSSSPTRHRGIRLHRRTTLSEADHTRHGGIPVTTPLVTLLDLATTLDDSSLERAVGEADKLGHVDPDTLRARLEDHAGRPGVGRLRALLDRDRFRLTDSELERRFLALARASGLPLPLTQQWLNGFRVDFYWPDLGLVVETDGLRYHRTPAQQARDGRRDQAHASAGLMPLRFSHAQVRYAPEEVRGTLASVATRLAAARRAT